MAIGLRSRSVRHPLQLNTNENLLKIYLPLQWQYRFGQALSYEDHLREVYLLHEGRAVVTKDARRQVRVEPRMVVACGSCSESVFLKRAARPEPRCATTVVPPSHTIVTPAFGPAFT